MKKYVLVGTGSRGTWSYIIPLTKDMQDCVKLCGIYDINKKRAEAAAKYAAYPVEIFDDFDVMLKTVQPDKVIVTSVDATHSDYIVRALEFGCDVISEKPITTDEDKMRQIYEAEQRTGKNVQVTFNCRFMPVYMRVKELVKGGAVGTPVSAHFEWLLDTSHGADYFRRWHAERKNSGSLLIHKSTHHFDLLNWIIDDEPVKVNAFGTRRFYGDGRRKHGTRCRDCQYKDECEFYCEGLINDSFHNNIYFNVDEVDGYNRDQCVFGERIDIEDTVSVSIKYKSGFVTSYSLTAHSPYEGMRLTINGTEGRLELKTGYAKGLFGGATKPSIQIFNRLGEVIDVSASKTEVMRNLPRFARVFGDGTGGHGGADDLMRDMIFRGIDEDPLDLLADSREGAMSIGIGIAANKSMAEDRAVYLSEFYDFYDL